MMKCLICFESATGVKPNDYFVSTQNRHVFHHCCVLQMIANGPTSCPLCDEDLAFHQFYRVDNNSRKLASLSKGNVPVLQPPQPVFAAQQATGSNGVYNANASDPWLLGNQHTRFSPDLMNPASYCIQPNYTFKLVVLGSLNVGKSSLLQRYADDRFDPMITATAGCDLRVKVVDVAGHYVRLNLWDTAGQERHRSIVDVYLRRADGIIFCFDITNAASFFALADWYDFAKRTVPSDTVKVIVGCKSDLWTQRVVGDSQIRNLAENWNAQYIYSSAKDATNVEIVFRSLAAFILEKKLPNNASTLPPGMRQPNPNPTDSVIKLTSLPGKGKKKKAKLDCCK